MFLQFIEHAVPVVVVTIGLQKLIDRACRHNDGPRRKRKKRPEEQRFDRKFQVVLAREKISSKFEDKSSTYRSSSFFFRNIPFNCDYTHVSA
jgi:hypothetical protein